MQLLDRIDMLSNLSVEEKDNLSLFCQEKYLQKGEILFQE